MGLTGAYSNPVYEEDGISIIRYAFSKGITFFDTSDIYGDKNANEILVGKVWRIFWFFFFFWTLKFQSLFVWHDCIERIILTASSVSFFYFVHQALKQLPREKIQLATKFGVEKLDLSNNHMKINGTPSYVRSCCEGSLKRLGVEYIDLYYQHRVDTTVPIEDTVKDFFLW